MRHRIRAVCLAITTNFIAAAGPSAKSCALQPQYLFFFGFNEASPTAPDFNQARNTQFLDAIANGWKANPGPLRVVGHTDEAELHSDPQLDAARAGAIRNALVQRGVDPAAITTQADAFNTPMIPRPGPEMQNRFVAVTAPRAGANCFQTPGIVR